jgi:hypothetical protein
VDHHLRLSLLVKGKALVTLLSFRVEMAKVWLAPVKSEMENSCFALRVDDQIVEIVQNVLNHKLIGW